MRVARISAVVVSLVIGVAAIVSSQGGTPSLVQTATVVVKPAMLAEYEEFAKKISAGATKIGMRHRTSAYQVVLGTRNYTFLYATRLSGWADLDSMPTAGDILTKAYGEAEAAKLLKAGRACMDSAQTDLSRYLTDLSTNLKLGDPAPFANMIRTQVKPDGVAAYQEYLTKLKAAQEQIPNHPMQIRIQSVQGPAFLFASVQYFSKYADRDSWPNPQQVLTKAFGEAEARRLQAANTAAIEHRETWVIRYRPDLSRGGVRATSN